MATPPKPAPHPAAVIGLALATLLALVGTLSAVWLADWRWAATGMSCALAALLLGSFVVSLGGRDRG